jgi:hypothetical protein
MRPNRSLNSDASPAALRAICSAPLPWSVRRHEGSRRHVIAIAAYELQIRDILQTR